MRAMRILFLSHYFPPEVNAPANRTYEHCRRWAAAGHEVHVVTCVPSHPRGVPFVGYRRGWYEREIVDGVHVHRVWTYLAPNCGVVRRTLNYLSFVPGAVWRALRLGRFDVIVATSPQFFCAVAGWVAGFLKRTPWIFELRDLWPDFLHAVGALRTGPLLRFWQRFELHLYRSASAIVCVSRPYMEKLVQRGIAAEKLRFVPNGVDVDEWMLLDREAARAALRIGAGDLVVSYVGTVGLAHGLGLLLDAASRVRSQYPRVRFLVVGDGAEREALEQHAVASGLDNVRFLGLVPHSRARQIITASDVAVVLLRGFPVFKTAVPSKMFEAMAAAVPILLGVDGEARRILEAAGAGFFCPPGDLDGFVVGLEKLMADEDLRWRMGRAGRSFVAREFSRDVCAREFLTALEELTSESVVRLPQNLPSSVGESR